MSAPDTNNVFAPDAKHIQITNVCWPRGWDALKLGFHFTWGCMAALGLLIWAAGIIQWLGRAARVWA